MERSRRSYIATVGIGLGFLSGCNTLRNVIGPNPDVTMEHVRFNPEILTVSRGEEVVWLNNTGQGHTVTAYEGSLPDEAEYFASGGWEREEKARRLTSSNEGGWMAEGDTYSHTFETRGSYPYFCIPHEETGMVGRVDVE